MKDFILTRLREPSTYAGIAALVGSLSFLPNADSLAQTIGVVGSAIVGVLAIWLPERKA